DRPFSQAASIAGDVDGFADEAALAGADLIDSAELHALHARARNHANEALGAAIAASTRAALSSRPGGDANGAVDLGLAFALRILNEGATRLAVRAAGRGAEGIALNDGRLGLDV